MTNKRFEPGKGDKGILIYDNEGPDDYYFVNDEKELQEFCNLINQREAKIAILEYKIKEFEVLAKQMNLQMGSLAYMKIKELDYPAGILHIAKDDPSGIKIYVKKNYNELLLKSFLKSTVPLGVTFRILVVEEVKTKEIKKDYMML